MGQQANYGIGGIGHLEKIGWTCRDLLRFLIAMDLRLMRLDLDDEAEGTLEQWAAIFERHPETWRLLLTGDHICVYWSFLSLRSSLFEDIKRGLTIDGRIPSSGVRRLCSPGTYNLYFSMLAVEPDHRRVGLPLLLTAFIEHLDALASSGIQFEEMCAVAYTPAGERFCGRSMGMQRIGQSEWGGIYTRRLDGNCLPELDAAIMAMQAKPQRRI